MRALFFLSLFIFTTLKSETLMFMGKSLSEANIKAQEICETPVILYETIIMDNANDLALGKINVECDSEL